jgi:chromosome segregation protein
MDTGVGAKGYSVIEQGQIGKIVNAKPEDRRLLIEEAAGIAKYKARKTESLRKLEAAQGNLSRLNDVVSEIERNLGSLDRQAQKARKYKEYKDELLAKEMTWGRRKAKVLEAKRLETESARVMLDQTLQGLRAELSIVETTLESEKIQQLTEVKVAEDLQGEISKLSDELTLEQSQLELAKRRREDLQAQIQAMENERATLEQSLSDEREALASRGEDLENLSRESEEASSSSRSLDQDVSAARRRVDEQRASLARAQTALMAGVTRSSELRSKDAALQERLDTLRAQIQSLSDKKQELDQRLEQAHQDSETLLAQMDGMGARRAEIQAQIETQRSKIQELELWRKKSDEEVRSARAHQVQLKSKIQSLEELEAAHEGLSDGAKSILEWAAQNGKESAYQLFAHLFQVDGGYENALAGLMETSLEAIIAKDAESAFESLSQLQGDRKGRASVQLLGIGRQEFHSLVDTAELEVSLSEAGFKFLGELTKFVRPNSGDTELCDLCAKKIKGVAVVEALKVVGSAQLSRLMERLDGWTLVDLQGTVLDATGILRGGSLEADSGSLLLRRKREIAELKALAGVADAELTSVEARLHQVEQELLSAEDALDQFKTQKQELEIEAARQDRDAQASRNRVRELQQELERMSVERQRLEVQLDQVRCEREQIEGSLADILSSRAEQESQVEQAQVTLTQIEAELQSQESLLQEKKIHEASLRERVQSIRRELESAQSFVVSRENRRNELDRMLARQRAEIEGFGSDDSEAIEKIQSLILSLEEKRSKLSSHKDTIEVLRAQESQALEKIKTLHRDGDEKAQALNQLAIEIEKIVGEYQHLKSNLEEKYGPGCLEIPVAAPIQEEMSDPVITQEMSEHDEQTLSAEVETLRERIRRLGEVNPMAIEEYEELKGRYDHLAKEKLDLEQSIENLQDAIEHINVTSEDRFKKAFDAIASRFEKLFPIIFGGGKAQLSLVYPEGSTDILDAGVDILAQPPGKKIVNIGLLSGGEKALTAVSLIFAIFMVKPSPFCILDEVDAPLDDANIGKFNALLKEMSSNTQFILITHNKKTMELNDTLYGVTMEEPGVSKMVSIEMR